MYCDNCGKEFEKEKIDGMFFEKIPCFSIHRLRPEYFCCIECMKTYFDEEYEAGALEESLYVC